MEIIRDSARDAWRDALSILLHEGSTFTDEHGHDCREILHLTLTITQPESIRDLLLTIRGTPTLYYPTPEELERAALSPKLGGFHYTIGQRLNHAQQLDYITRLLKHTPYSRRAISVIWQPEADAREDNRDTPGLISLDFKLRANKLYLAAFIRSADVYLGIPASAYQLFIIQQTLANRLASQQGSITLHLASAHIFSHEEDAIKNILSQEA